MPSRAAIPLNGAILLLWALSIPCPALAQHWTRLTPTRTKPEVRVPYFINPDTGFTYQAGFTFSYHRGADVWPVAPPNLLRTTNGGKTWAPLRLFDDTLRLSITQMCFVSPVHGYVSTYGDQSSRRGGIFETFDLGNTWKRISDARPFTGIYATKGKVFASSAGFDTAVAALYGENTIGYGPILFTSNGGASWDSISASQGLPITHSPGFQRIYGNRDSLVATVFFDSTGGIFSLGADSLIRYTTYLVYSTDLGKSWNSSILDHDYVWGMMALFIVPHSCTIYRQFDKDPSHQDVYSILESTGDYSSWTTSIQGRESGAWIAGNSCAQYLSLATDVDTETVQTPILMRTTDNGHTWNELVKGAATGPSFLEIDDLDYPNLSVVGNGSVVYADSFNISLHTQDMGGSLWKTTDGGDGSLSAAALAPRLSFRHFTSDTTSTDTLHTSCTGGMITEIDQNINCALTQFQGISIDGLDSSEFNVVSRTHHATCLNLPDTTTIVIPSLPEGVWKIRIHAHYEDDEFAETDTSFTVMIISKTSGASLKAIALIRTASERAGTGDTIDVPLYLSGVPSNISLQLSAATIQTFRLSFSTSLLKATTFNSMIAGASGSIAGIGQNEVELTIKLRQSVSINGQTLIGVLRCVVQPSTINETRILLTQATINSGDTNCILTTIPEDEGILFTVSASGVRETAHQAMNLMLVPNPATNELTVNVDGNRLSVHCEIIDALGITRLQRVVDGSDIILNVASLARGMYFLRVTDPDGTSVTKTVAITR
jgi:hypothetical protein